MFFNYYPEVKDILAVYGIKSEVYVKDTKAELWGEGCKVVLDTDCGSLDAVIYRNGILEGVIKDCSYGAFKSSLKNFLDDLFNK